MNPALERLMAEHRVIESVLDALDRFDGGPGELAELVEFFSLYADKLHHGKEEEVLFNTMVDNGFPRDHGPIAVMLHEHDIGRALVGEMREASLRDTWTDKDRIAVSQTASEFSAHLRQHIRKEDQVLYPMAETNLPAEAWAAVNDRCAAVDAASADRQRLEQLAARLQR